MISSVKKKKSRKISSNEWLSKITEELVHSNKINSINKKYMDSQRIFSFKLNKKLQHQTLSTM
jgi:hypothetical protein